MIIKSLGATERGVGEARRGNRLRGRSSFFLSLRRSSDRVCKVCRFAWARAGVVWNGRFVFDEQIESSGRGCRRCGKLIVGFYYERIKLRYTWSFKWKRVGRWDFSCCWQCCFGDLFQFGKSIKNARYIALNWKIQQFRRKTTKSWFCPFEKYNILILSFWKSRNPHFVLQDL